jgi:hypothetical protein
MNTLNHYLDSLPCSRLGRYSREVPAFRVMGYAGFYCAAITTLGAGLACNLSILVLAGLEALAAVSFYLWARGRKWVAGRENIAAFEHIWFALAILWGALWLAKIPAGRYLDVVAPSLALFLAVGRIGCLLAGCCHGRPSRLGIRYPHEFAREGQGHLAGIRLFPVQALEGVGLLLIAVTSTAALPFARPGHVLIWFLLSYGIMRFGMEGLRGDHRPHILGFSVARWMSLLQVLFAVGLAGTASSRAWIGLAAVPPSVALTLAIARRRDRRVLLIRPKHVEELRGLVLEELERPARNTPRLRTSSAGLGLALSLDAAQGPSTVAHISLSLPEFQGDLLLLCAVAARAFPHLRSGASRFTQGRVLHLAVPLPLERSATASEAAESLARKLYGETVEIMQRDWEVRQKPPGAQKAMPPRHAPDRWYFTASSPGE